MKSSDPLGTLRTLHRSVPMDHIEADHCPVCRVAWPCDVGVLLAAFKVPVPVWVVGWAQDLDDWGVHGVYRSEATANGVADEVQRARHADIRKVRIAGSRPGLSGRREAMGWHGLTDPTPAGPDPGSGCCRPQVIEVMVK